MLGLLGVRVRCKPFGFKWPQTGPICSLSLSLSLSLYLFIYIYAYVYTYMYICISLYLYANCRKPEAYPQRKRSSAGTSFQNPRSLDRGDRSSPEVPEQKIVSLCRYESMAVWINWRSFCWVGVLLITALLFEVYLKAPDCWKQVLGKCKQPKHLPTCTSTSTSTSTSMFISISMSTSSLKKPFRSL